MYGNGERTHGNVLNKYEQKRPSTTSEALLFLNCDSGWLKETNDWPLIADNQYLSIRDLNKFFSDLACNNEVTELLRDRAHLGVVFAL